MIRVGSQNANPVTTAKPDVLDPANCPHELMAQEARHVPEAHLPAPGAARSRQAQPPVRREQHEPDERESREQPAPAQWPDQKRSDQVQDDVPREAARDIYAHRGGPAVGREHGADQEQPRGEHEPTKEARQGLVGEHQPELMELSQREKEHVGADQSGQEQALGAQAISKIAGRDLHQRIDQRHAGHQRSRLREGQPNVAPDERQEQPDAAEGKRLGALAERDQRRSQLSDGRCLRRQLGGASRHRGPAYDVSAVARSYACR